MITVNGQLVEASAKKKKGLNIGHSMYHAHKPQAVQKTTKSAAWYALRRTLPVWNFEESFQELVECLPQYEIDEIIIKVDTEEFSHGQPRLDWIKKYQARLFRIKEEMDKQGIIYSLNPWITLGHCDRGRDEKLLPGLQCMVGHDGTQAKSCACPLSDVWRRNTAEVWTLYAETRPHVIWVEDDIRTFNHLPVNYGCFCPLHMKRFSERIGKSVSREELIAAILAPGKPHPWRKEYLDMQNEIMTDTVSFLVKTVHKVSPDTHMGLMSSGPRMHCLEGRRWTSFAKALADGKKLFSRPPVGAYFEKSLRDNYYAHDVIKLTRHCLPDNVIEQGEVENFPYTNYSKSISFTFVQTVIFFAFGCRGVALNLFDHCGSPMENMPEYGRMLKEKKAFLNALGAKAQCAGRFRGIQLLHSETGSYVKRLNINADYGDLSLSDDGFCCSQKLEMHGIPTVYDDEDVIATTGQTIAAFDDAQITDMLKKGVFLDASAAEILFDRGFGHLIGLKKIASPKSVDELDGFSAEEFFNPAFGGDEKKFLTFTIRNTNGKRLNFSLIEPDDNAEVISRVVDADANPGHISMCAFENKLGGRVIVHCLAFTTCQGPGFNSLFRAEQLAGAMKWLAKDRVPILVKGNGVYPLAFRKDCRDFILLGMFNLSLDPWSRAKFILDTEDDFTSVLILNQAGEWCAAEGSVVSTRKNKTMTVEVFRKISFDTPMFILLKKKKS
jgi:hypothetical protein